VYFARLFVEQQIEDKKHLLEIDARPSDCLSLALMNNIPIFCKKDVLDKIINIQA
jgi:bifunctional DNase/RNase